MNRPFKPVAPAAGSVPPLVEPAATPNEERVVFRHPSGVRVETWPENAEIWLFHGFVLVMTGPLAMSA